MSRRASRALLALVIVVSLSGLSACSGPQVAESPDLKGSWKSARASLSDKAADAFLVSAAGQSSGTREPDEWSLVFYSPSTGHSWRVTSLRGELRPAEDMGQSNLGADPDTALSWAAVKVKPATAAAKARAAGEKTGPVPEPFAIGGSFVDVLAAAREMRGGEWTIVFASPSAPQGSRTFIVDMRTGAVTEAGR